MSRFMPRVRWWSMYLTSCAVGYLLAGVLWTLGQRWHEPVRVQITRTARGHAEDAEHRVGPYLAPVTFAVFLILAAVFGALLIAGAG